jgi:phytoene dehydrogenase-like protein
VDRNFDVAVVGGGVAGLATAARLQAEGLRTVVLEAHGQPGGCAGFYHRKGFSFDVGATTLVDFGPGGVGGQLLARLGGVLARAGRWRPVSPPG